MSTFSSSKSSNNTGELFKQTTKCPQTCSEELIGNLGVPRHRLRKIKRQTVMVFGVPFSSEMLPYLLPRDSLRNVSILIISAMGTEISPLMRKGHSLSLTLRLKCCPCSDPKAAAGRPVHGLAFVMQTRSS